MICPKCGKENSDNAKFCSECAAPLVAVVETVIEKPLNNGMQLEELKAALHGKYEIIREIGRGGMGIVYECRELSLDRTVALKVLPRELTYDKQFVERFKSEIKILARIEHPNIVPMISADETSGFIYFTMKFVKGRNLANLIKEKGKLSAKETANIALQIAQALSCAHDANVLHRDLKPENIMIDDRGHVYVMDFGIARVLDGTRMTRTGSALGTPEYMSPEQCSGLSEADNRSDIYSLGAVMYEMLNGAVPFRGETTAVMYQHVNVEPVPVEKIVPGIPLGMANLVNSSLAKKPEKRPQAAAEIIASLQKPIDRKVKSGKLPDFQKVSIRKLLSGINIFKINRPVIIALLLVILITPYFILYAIQRWDWNLTLADYIPVFYIKFYESTYKGYWKREYYDVKYYSRCGKNYEEGNYYDAIDDCTKSIEVGYKEKLTNLRGDKTNDLHMSYYTRALAKAEIKDYDDAINDFNIAIKNSPNDEELYIDRGAAKCKKGDYNSASVDFNLALNIDARNPRIYTNIANLKYLQNDIEGAITFSTTAIDVARNNIVLKLSLKRDEYYNAYHYYFDDQDITQSQYNSIKSFLIDNKFNSFISLWHEIPYRNNGYFNDFYRNKSSVLNNLHDLQEAYNIRAKYKYEKKDLTGALYDCETALSINSNDSEMYLIRGIIKSDKGDFTGAISDYTRSIDINPKNAEVYKKRGEAKKQKGDEAGAMVDFDTWEKLK